MDLSKRFCGFSPTSGTYCVKKSMLLLVCFLKIAVPKKASKRLPGLNTLTITAGKK